MANPNLFPSAAGNIATPDTVNNAGGAAYSLPEKAKLAQLAVTGCFNDTYYVTAATQLTDVIGIATKVDSEFLAKLAVYSRTHAFMKDMPALLLAILASRKDPESRTFLRLAFPLVIDNTKMLRNFAQIVRSGVTGRKSFGSTPRSLMHAHLAARSPDRIFADSIGDKPSLADVISMVHPKAMTPEHDGLYAYLLDKPLEGKTLPALVAEYEAFKAAVKDGTATKAPKVPFQMLASLENLPVSIWKDFARNGGWHMLRMNINAFQKHGVFNDKELVAHVAKKLGDKAEVARSRVFPYQLLTTFQNIGDNTPMPIKLALQDAMEAATANIPTYAGNVVVAVDVSGSMGNFVTGLRKGATTKTRCIDVAALVASAILRTNPSARIMPFDTRVHATSLNPRDSVMTNASTLSAYGGGGTACHLPLEQLNTESANVDLVIFVSDNESWMNARHAHTGTHMATEWSRLKRRNPKAKLVCIDLTPNMTTQVQSDKSVLNVGGFSDAVFNVIQGFVSGDTSSWVSVIGSVTLAQKEAAPSISVDEDTASE